MKLISTSLSMPNNWMCLMRNSAPLRGGNPVYPAIHVLPLDESYDCCTISWEVGNAFSSMLKQDRLTIDEALKGEILL